MAGKSVPNVLWAQRKETLLLTVDVPAVDPQTAKASFDNQKFVFSGTGGTQSHEYATEIPLFAEVSSEDAKWKVTARNVVFVLQKKAAEWWPRLTKDKGKFINIKVDWDQWKDSDEGEDFDTSGMGAMPGGMGGMDIQQMLASMGGAQGHDGADGDDSDDDLPDLDTPPSSN